MSKDTLALAAEMIRKGGTLLSEPCQVCNGVQVKFEDSIICVNCNRKVSTNKSLEVKLNDIRSIIIQKINELIPLLNEEKDIDKQLSIAKLVNDYLEILEKLNKKGS